MSSPEILCLGEKPRTEASAWSLTDNKDTEFTFAWAIKNFSRKMESYDHGKSLYSDIFTVRVEGLETSWRLQCFPNGKKEAFSGFVGVYLQCTDLTPLKTLKRQLSFTLDLVSVEGSGKQFNQTRNIKKCCSDDSWSIGWGWGKFVTHEKLESEKSKLLPQDCFEVLCVMKFYGPEVTTSGATSPTNLLLAPKEVKGEAFSCSGLVDLLETGVLSDVKLVCEGRIFSCHKAILASKSPVFMATFCNNMKEKATGQINIQGIDPDTVEDMLNHVYGCEIDGLEDKAEELLVAADRYNLKQLKKSCEGVLARSLNISNCLDYLILADRHAPDTLKPVVINFIVENFLEVVALDDWMEKLNNFSKVFREVFDELAALRPHKKKKKH